MILSWDKPKKAMTDEAWKSISAEGAPPGVYTPNMSDEDRLKWKAKVVGVKSGKPQVEIRKTTGGTQLLIIVSLKGGFKYGSSEIQRSHNETDSANIHISANGPVRFSWQDYADFGKAIEEAREYLNSL